MLRRETIFEFSGFFSVFVFSLWMRLKHRLRFLCNVTYQTFSSVFETDSISTVRKIRLCLIVFGILLYMKVSLWAPFYMKQETEDFAKIYKTQVLFFFKIIVKTVIEIVLVSHLILTFGTKNNNCNVILYQSIQIIVF